MRFRPRSATYTVMHSARTLIVAAALALVAADARSARAQESMLEGAKAAARSGAGDARAAIEYGRALRRAGHDNEALQELRRAAALAPTGPAGIEARWE